MKLNQIKLLTAAITVAFAGAAHATSVNPDGFAPADSVIDVGSLDWAPGSALITPTNGASVTSPKEDDVFQTYAQARLNAFQDANGNGIGGLALNGPTAATNYEWTYIAAFQEQVISVTGGGGTGTAVFNTVTGGTNFFKIYYDATPDGNAGNGTGFGPDGVEDPGSVLILSGTILPFDPATLIGQTNFTANGVSRTDPDLDNFGLDNYPLIDSISGTGGGKLLVGNLTFLPEFFPGGLGSILDVVFDTQLNLAFTQTNPSSCFNNGSGGLINGAGPNTLTGVECKTNTVGTINGVNGVNEILMTDSTSNLTSVPEPMSVALLGLGLAAMGLTLHRRKN